MWMLGAVLHFYNWPEPCYPFNTRIGPCPLCMALAIDSAQKTARGVPLV